jgi:hypothetical protein
MRARMPATNSVARPAYWLAGPPSIASCKVSARETAVRQALINVIDTEGEHRSRLSSRRPAFVLKVASHLRNMSFGLQYWL